MVAIAMLVLFAVAEIVCRLLDRQNTLWRARVVWLGSTYVHASASRADALEWAACYPWHAEVDIQRVYRGDAVTVASRQGV